MKMILAFAVSVLSSIAFADHNLAEAMHDSDEVAMAVVYLEKQNSVYCDAYNSVQSYYYAEEEKEGLQGTAWTQVAPCYALGGYGKAILGEITISYKWENDKATQVLADSYTPSP